jgi:hypothetical protein
MSNTIGPPSRPDGRIEQSDLSNGLANDGRLHGSVLDRAVVDFDE